MATQSGLKEADVDIEEKFAYKELINPKLKGKSSDWEQLKN